MKDPDWFDLAEVCSGDSNKPLLEAHYTWVEFTAKPEGLFAWRAIVAIAKAGMTIPPELIPWLEAAQSDWATYNRSAARKRETKEAWRQIVVAVHELVLRGYTNLAAAYEVAEERSLKPSTVEARYKESE